MIRRFLSSALLAACALLVPNLGHAQASPLGSFAVDFDYSIPSQSPNLFSFSPTGVCQQNAAGIAFFPFNVNAPVYVLDITAANSERLTPTAIVRTSAQCGITITPTNSHYSFRVTSGTGGLQEALNAVAINSANSAVPIFLDRRWYNRMAAMGLTPSTVIAAAKGNTKAYLIDLTTLTSGRWASYSWSGTAYVAN